MLLNCDIGERGSAHKVDDALIPYIDIANIACGGHAGDKESVEYYLELAKKYKVKTTAHLSYPDKKNFGRVVLDLSKKELLNSLDQQYALADQIKCVKLHGALYNQANIDHELSKIITQWFTSNDIQEVLTQENSELDKVCQQKGINVIYEAFLDRRYIYENEILKLAPRTQKGAVIHDIKIAKEQYQQIKNGYVLIDKTQRKLYADTLCVHSDSPSALEILKAIKNV